eukprot:m.22141 g.22141  ORF g.22141 m.22141 type:complete len:122 (-) comp8358_c0_seq2:201-566(-)
MDDADNTYVIRPSFHDKFRPAQVQETLHEVMSDFFSDKVYDAQLALEWPDQLCNAVRAKLKELELPRYKYVVQAVIGEKRGEGVKVGARCLWDSDTDNVAQNSYVNDTLFCVVMAYGVYHY